MVIVACFASAVNSPIVSAVIVSVPFVVRLDILASPVEFIVAFPVEDTEPLKNTSSPVTERALPAVTFEVTSILTPLRVTSLAFIPTPLFVEFFISSPLPAVTIKLL